MCLSLYHTYTSWQERTLSSLASWHFIILLDLFFCFPDSDHVMFSREFLSFYYLCIHMLEDSRFALYGPREANAAFFTKRKMSAKRETRGGEK